MGLILHIVVYSVLNQPGFDVSTPICTETFHLVTVAQSRRRTLATI